MHFLIFRSLEAFVWYEIGSGFANQMVKWNTKAREDFDKLLAKAKETNECGYFGIFFLLFCGMATTFFLAISHNILDENLVCIRNYSLLNIGFFIVN